MFFEYRCYRGRKMVIIIYFFIVVFATCIGSAAGLGGGVIIKPLFDLLGFHTMNVIGLYSAISLFFMSITSIYKQYKNKAKFNIRVSVLMAIGSILGGLTGDYIFSFVYETFGPFTKVIQNSLLSIVLLIIILYTLKKDKIKNHHVKSSIVIAIIGFLLGNLSVFLGIGGGPITLAILSFLFSFTSKESGVLYSCIIFFSQSTKIITTYVKTNFVGYDLSVVPFIIVAALIGGYVGAMINKRMTNKQVDKLYIGILSCLIVLALINIATELFA